MKPQNLLQNIQPSKLHVPSIEFNTSDRASELHTHCPSQFVLFLAAKPREHSPSLLTCLVRLPQRQLQSALVHLLLCAHRFCVRQSTFFSVSSPPLRSMWCANFNPTHSASIKTNRRGHTRLVRESSTATTTTRAGSWCAHR